MVVVIHVICTTVELPLGNPGASLVVGLELSIHQRRPPQRTPLIGEVEPVSGEESIAAAAKEGHASLMLYHLHHKVHGILEDCSSCINSNATALLYQMCVIM